MLGRRLTPLEALTFDTNVALKGYMAEAEANSGKPAAKRVTSRRHVDELYERVRQDMAKWVN